MFLAIDIGNTNTNFGLFQPAKEKSQLIRSFSIPTYGYTLNKLKAKLGKSRVEDTVICSVVPKMTVLMRRDLSAYAGREPHIIGKDILVPIKNLYRRPEEVGQDRLVNAYAALNLYKPPLIAIDFGTAVTFDIITKKGQYLGGMILPGLKISLEALNQRTALLPKVSLEEPDGLIGRDTKNSMLSGIFYGFGSLTDELVMRIRKAIGPNASVVATGGNIELISKYCRKINKIDVNLTLKGLGMLYSYKKKCSFLRFNSPSGKLLNSSKKN